ARASSHRLTGSSRSERLARVRSLLWLARSGVSLIAVRQTCVHFPALLGTHPIAQYLRSISTDKLTVLHKHPIADLLHVNLHRLLKTQTRNSFWFVRDYTPKRATVASKVGDPDVLNLVASNEFGLYEKILLVRAGDRKSTRLNSSHALSSR